MINFYRIPEYVINMNNDIFVFLASVAILALYLVFSALTEMGTKLPWKK